MESLRNLIAPQIQTFKRENTASTCYMCSCTLTKTHVDHVIHFAKLVHDYTQLYGPRQDDDSFAFNGGFYEYHKQHAHLRIVCPTCNLTRPKWRPSNLTCCICNEIQKLTPDGICQRCDSKYT